MPAMPPAPAPESEYEQWENTTQSRVWIKVYNQQGTLVDRIIEGRRKFQVTPKERKLNQESAYNERQDHFHNGAFAPVRLVETADDIESIRSNPNIVGEDEMKELLNDKQSLGALEDRVNSLNNPYALQRMLELARSDDSTTVKQVSIIEERLHALAPATFTETTTVGGPSRAFPNAVQSTDLGSR